jgi:3-dehydroquinate synthetase
MKDSNTSKESLENIRVYEVKPKLTDMEIAKLEGMYFTEEDFDIIVKENADIYRLDSMGNRHLLLKIRKNVIPSDICKKTFMALQEEAKKPHTNRGAAAGILSHRKLPPYVKEIIAKGVALKNKIVLKDPFDNGIRKTLNFGHTSGHAIESLLLGAGNELLHGEAIVIGMQIESHLSYQKKLLSKKELDEILTVFNEVFQPNKINDLNLDSIFELMKNDKKSTNNKFQFALIDKIGSCKFDVVVSDLQIKKAFEFYNTSF